MRKTNVRVAGVTFPNEQSEGGRSRQDILAELTNEPFPVTLKHAIFKNDQGVEEPAIKVYHAETNEMIGWIPRTSIRELWDIPRMVGYADFYKDTYGCSLVPQHDPSPKQYAIMSKMVRSGKMARPAVFDRDVYRRAISKVILHNTDKE